MTNTTVTLNYPVTDEANAEVRELHLRRATVGDLEVMQKEKTQIGQSILLLSLVSGLSPQTVRKLDASDFNQLSEAVTGFLE